jgi:hypothetical protein
MPHHEGSDHDGEFRRASYRKPFWMASGMKIATLGRSIFMLRTAGHLAPGRGTALVVPGGDKGDIHNWALTTRFYVLRR